MIKKEINYTKSQEEALNKIRLFLSVKTDINDINSRIFLLEGPAGSGKTTIIKHALGQKIKEDEQTIDSEESFSNFFTIPKVVGVTMAHKAKRVLSQSIHVCTTFASCFGLKQFYEEDGQIIFKRPERMTEIPIGETPVDVFVHDECSMYDEFMMNHVINTHPIHSKIIFMGDAAQLPPVTKKKKEDKSDDDSDSPIFYLPLSESNKHSLKERVRQTEDNPIVLLSDIIREEIFGKHDLSRVLNEMKTDKIINGKGFKTIFYKDFFNSFSQIEKDDFENTKIIAYRNDKVNLFNKTIRQKIYNNPIQKYIENEIVYMNDTYYHRSTLADKKSGMKWTCYNSDEYKIIAVNDIIVDSVHCHKIYIDKTNHSNLEKYNNPFIYVVSNTGEQQYQREKAKLYHYAVTATYNKSNQWKKYYDFIGQFGQVSYGYCYTAYKVQGSTFKNVFIDVNDILTVGPLTNKRKLQCIYTALTRASHLCQFLQANK